MDSFALPDLSRSNHHSETEPDSAMAPMEGHGRSIADNNASSRDLRSIVASRFMGMLRAHDRTRLELLSGQPPVR